MLCSRIRFWFLVILLSWSVCASAAEVGDPEELWRHEVEPLLEEKCSKCHGGVRQRGGLDVRSLVNLLKGGEQDASIVPGDPEESLLYQYVSDGTMPPDEEKHLAPEEITTIVNWIRALPPREELIPAGGETADWPAEYARALKARREPAWTPPDDIGLSDAIDGFIRHEWERLGIQPSGPVDEPALVRRLYLDLAGRIPAPDEVNAALQWDESEHVTGLVDQLLQSPEYARHMRDVFDVVLMGRPSIYREASNTNLHRRRSRRSSSSTPTQESCSINLTCCRPCKR